MIEATNLTPEQTQDVTKIVSQETNKLNILLTAIVIVLFVGFAGCFIAATAMLVDSYNSKAASFQNLTNQMQAQNAKIDLLTQEFNKK